MVQRSCLLYTSNLVCPAEFDTGASKNAMILSVPEGDDKPLKYPLMFSIVDVLLINKIDAMDYFDFDMKACDCLLYTSRLCGMRCEVTVLEQEPEKRAIAEISGCHSAVSYTHLLVFCSFCQS